MNRRLTFFHCPPAYLFWLFLCLAFPFRGFSQQSNPPGGNAIFAPFISRLQAEARNNLIRLSWSDSSDVRGPVYIYRSQTPFDEAHSYSRLRSVEVPYGVQSYIDEIEETGTWHYFLIASDAGGVRYELVIPFTNTIAVSIDELSDLGIAPSANPVQPSGELRIFSLSAAVEGDGVVINYRLADGVKTTIVYRSVRPIGRTQDLLEAVIVQSGAFTPIVDYPVPGIPYYYAVVSEEELLSGSIGIFPGYNATQEPVEVPAGRYRVGLGESPYALRSMPLPLISIDAISPGAAGYTEIPPPVRLSADAAKAASALPSPSLPRKKTIKSPRAFEQDLQPPSGGEEYGLRSIVQGPFIKRDWENSKAELSRYLSLPRSAASAARARFYLGQAFYYTNALREALFEFLVVQSQYPREANEWVQAVLTLLVN
jgi:hypothetical protein